MKHNDDQFYRAEVTDIIDDIKHVSQSTVKFTYHPIKNFLSQVLLFVDYGMSFEINFEQMYEWSDTWDYVPFLAHLCYLSNVKMRQYNDEEAIIRLTSKIVNKIVKASLE